MTATTPLKVLHVITGLDVGGAETMLLRLVTQPVPGVEQRVVSLRPGGVLRPRLEDAGVAVEDLGAASPAGFPAALVRLRAMLRRQRPDVVQSWMYHADLLSALALRTLPATGRPRLCWGVRCSDMDLADYGRILRLTVQTCARLSAWPDMVIANSHAGRAAHLAIGYRPRRFEVVWNGIDLDGRAPDVETRSAVRAELGIPQTARLFAHVARVDPMKDHALFQTALAAVPEAHGLMIGLGTEDLPKQERLLALGRRADVPRLLKAADAIVCSSAYGEGFPNVIAEGMAAGCLPISTDVGDARRMVGTTGLIVPPRDAEALAEAMAQVTALPLGDLDECRATARRRAEAEFSMRAAADGFRALWTDAPIAP